MTTGPLQDTPDSARITLGFQAETTQLFLQFYEKGSLKHEWYDNSSIPFHQFITISIKQVKIMENVYQLQLHVDNISKNNFINSNARIFFNMKIYLSDPSSTPAKADVRNFIFDNYYIESK